MKISELDGGFYQRRIGCSTDTDVHVGRRGGTKLGRVGHDTENEPRESAAKGIRGKAGGM